jgi:hypothetical protein
MADNDTNQNEINNNSTGPIITTEGQTTSQTNNSEESVSTVGDEILDNQEEASILESLLWYCAGADKRLLVRCMSSDRVKYQGLGGIVLATGLLAFIAMTFAINVIFFEGEWSGFNSSLIVPLIIGLIWGLIIFNLDRFIVSSTGKGDGTEKITSSEIIGALPRILMALVIAFSISAPLEIVMFEGEINKIFKEKNEKLLGIQKTEYETSNASDIKIIEDVLAIKNAEKAEQDAIYKKNEALVAYEIAHGGCRGKCEEFKILRDKSEKKSNDLKNEIDKLEIKRNNINNERDLKLNEYKAKIEGKPGLLERLLLLEEIPGAKIPVWLVRFLFIVIEVGPLFFKMMLTKSTYDHLKHHYDEMVLARYGIFEDESMVAGSSDGIAEKFYVYGNVSLLQHQNKITLDEQRRIDQQVLSMWQNYISTEMTQNPERFVSWLQQNTGNSKVTNTTITDDNQVKIADPIVVKEPNSTTVGVNNPPVATPEGKQTTKDPNDESITTTPNQEINPVLTTSIAQKQNTKQNELVNADGSITIVPPVNENIELI